MKFFLYSLIMICFTSCFDKYPILYIEYTYKLKNQSKFFDIMNKKIEGSIDLFPKGIEYRYRKGIASSPYLITVHIENSNDIEIDDILLIMDNKAINLFKEDFYIYDSSLKRNYNESEKAIFISDRKIKSRSSSMHYILIGFENVELKYKDVSSFEIIVPFKFLNYANEFITIKVTKIFSRDKNSRCIFPTTWITERGTQG